MMARRRKKIRKKSRALCVRDDLLADPANASVPPCPLHATCGGCTWQDVDYGAQLTAKRDFISECFRSVELEDAAALVETPEPSPQPFRYRNQMEFSFAARRWLTQEEIDSEKEFRRDFALGLHVPGGFDKVLDIPECFLQHEEADGVLRCIADFARSSDRAPYDQRSHEGFWRYVNIRASVSTGEILLYVVTAERDAEIMAALGRRVLETCPQVTTIANGVTASVADTSVGAEVFVDNGPGMLIESLNGIELEVTSASFFQPNTPMAAEMFRWVADAASVGGSRVLDLFCGGGAISFHLAREADAVLGLESFEPSVLAARRNAERNAITNCRFEVANLDKGLPEETGGFDCVVADPPRVGMHKKLVAALGRMQPPRIVSVGCNPKTQAENLAVLLGAAPYEIVAMKAFDQFPHTPHVENVAVLELRGSR